MKVWRVLLMLPLLLLQGCLVTLPRQLEQTEPAPASLLGTWVSRDGWGDRRYLQIEAEEDGYHALVWHESLQQRQHGHGHEFCVSHHGRRWYFTTPAPERLGGNHAIGGFEVTADNELVIYSLDTEAVAELIGRQELQGEVLVTEEGDGILLDSAQPAVFDFLDDPANAYLFIEAARFVRLNPQEP